MAVQTLPGAAPLHPVQYDVPYPENLSRWLIFVKWLLAIPHFIILYFLNIALSLVTLIALFAILFTTKYPDGMFKFAVGCQRWAHNVNTYYWLMRDEYPPFSLDAGQYPLAYEVPYPENLNRWLPLIKWLLVIPNLIVLMFVIIAMMVVTFIAWFVILFTGKYPQGLFDFSVGAMRWSARANAYVYLFTDAYPPFSTKA